VAAIVRVKRKVKALTLVGDSGEPERVIGLIDDDDKKDNSHWVGLAVGLGVAAAIGVIGLLIYVLRKNTTQQQLGDSYMPLQLPPPAPPAPQVYLISTSNGATITSATPAAPPASSDASGDNETRGAVQRMEMTLNGLASQLSRPAQQPIAQTLALPSLSDRSPAVRIVQATKTAYDAVLRVVGPAGAFAAFSTDPVELSRPDMPAVPTGNTIIVQSGHWHPIRLLPRQAVYGKGQAPNSGETVFVSVTANEAGARVYG
jgi:hypothetical protein